MPFTVGRITQLDKATPLSVLQELNLQGRKDVWKELTEKKDEDKMEVETKEIVQVHDAAPPVSFDEMRDMMGQLEKFIQELLKSNLDFGTIPGTNKPTLYKAGAEKLCGAFNLTPHYKITDQTVDPLKEWREGCVGFYRYQVLCELINRRTGQVWATCLGECVSTERGREKAPSNTILKMAQKRAYVGAALHATFTSDRFTADMDTYDNGHAPTKKHTAAAKPPVGDLFIFQFGKHKGKAITEVDKGYLTWIAQNEDMAAKNPDTVKAAKAELERRKNGDKKPTKEEALASTPSADPTRQEVIESIIELEAELTNKDKAFKISDARTAACGSTAINEATEEALAFYMKLLKEKLAGTPG